MRDFNVTLAAVNFEQNAPRVPLGAFVAVMNNALIAGANPQALIGFWIDAACRARDLLQVKAAVQAYLKRSGQPAAKSTWKWEKILQDSAQLRSALHISTYFNLADLLRANGDKTGVVAVYRAASQQFPGLSAPMLKLADFLHAEGETGEALKVLGEFLKTSPKDAFAASRYCALTIESGLNDQTVAALVQITLGNDVPASIFDVWITRAAAQNRLDWILAALAAYSRIDYISDQSARAIPGELQKEPARGSRLHIATYFTLADFLVTSANAAEAEDVLEAAIHAFPAYSGPTIRLAALYSKQGKQVGAQRVLTEFLQDNPGNADVTQFLEQIRFAQEARRQSANLRSIQRKQIQKIARLEKMLTGKFKERASNLLLELYARRGLMGSFNRPAIVASAFESSAFDLPRMRHLCSILHARFPSGLPRTYNVPECAFVRGVMEFYTHEFETALAHLRLHKEIATGSNSALVAEEIVGWITHLLSQGPGYLEFLRSQTRKFNLARYAGKNVLVLSDMPSHFTDEFLGQAPADANFTILSVTGTASVPKRARRKWWSQSDEYWYEEEGKADHTNFFENARQVSQSCLGNWPLLQDSQWATSVQLLDRNLDLLVAMKKLNENMAMGAFTDILVITSRYLVFDCVRAMARGRKEIANVQAHFPSRPSLNSAPSFGFWPGDGRLRDKFLPALARRNRANTNCLRRFPLLPTKMKRKLAVKNDAPAPAIIVWTIGTPVYEIALHRLLTQVLSSRPAIVILYGDHADAHDGNLSKMRDLNRSSRYQAKFVSQSLLQRFGSSYLPDLEKRAYYSQITPANALTTRRAAPMPVIAEVLLQSEIATKGIISMAAAIEYLKAIIAIQRPAYLLTAPGRAAFQGAVAEFLARYEVPTLDIHLVFSGTSARQIRPPHLYFASIDTDQIEMLQEFWKLPKAHVFAAGFLWQEAISSVEAGRQYLDPQIARMIGKNEIVLVATQPSTPRTAQAFVKAAMIAALARSKITLVIKPHPSEPDVAAEAYRELAIAFGLKERSIVLDRKANIDPWLRSADLVVTRFSNVGLQAAQLRKPVVRAVWLDHLMPVGSGVAGYAANARSEEEFVANVCKFLASKKAKGEMNILQEVYFAKNPSLQDGKGAERVVEFIEARVFDHEGTSLVKTESTRAFAREKRNNQTRHKRTETNRLEG